ncbi:DUF1223 domain-containing protein [Methylobacterium pseudosasicola]|uniref:DUF1223 domain-containing protein n=1 Tax=Methylobacterium pseudosasicola TaxID=582667 RepID=A0A1I4PGT1_9HYPH|nr:DUF1223 domain-containing protein [Methylobacterium pseudosasicola]SFM26785.1 hypothetical protein SAMN05192568_102490 [Methylobacterium pseudosasicola]
MTHRPRARTRFGVFRALCAAGLVCAVSASAQARAEPIRAVVELFTSQGCGACRSADPIIRDLARQPGVVALTLPVTYWDYLGWKDTLALRPFTERQRAYARVRGARQVFTPQVVVDGSGFAVGSDRAALDRLMREATQHGGLPIPVRGEIRGDRISVEVGAAPELKAETRGDVWLVPVLRSRAIAIQGGENGGRTATYVNVVRGLQRLGPWTGQPTRFDVPGTLAEIADADSWVILVQGAAEGRPGRILGAAKGPGL